MDAIEIKLSKNKILLLLAGSLMFVVLGICFIINPEEFVTSVYRYKASIFIVGTLSVIFFGACAVYGIKKLFDNTSGLIINQEGIIDNSNGTSIGLINWTDILSIQTKQVASTKFLLVLVNDPDKYLNRATGFKKKLLQANMRYYGTPLSITSSSLKCDFDDLEKIVRSSHEKFSNGKL